MLKSMLVAAALIGSGIIVLVGLLVVFQDRLLYLPARSDLRAFVGDDLQAWPATGEIRGLLAGPAAGMDTRGTVIVFHGNAGHAGHRRYYLPVFQKRNLRVILAEYPGYGPRAGKPNETLLTTDAVQTITMVHEQYGGPVLVMGVSLGAAVASAAAPRVRETIVGLVLITPWSRLIEVATSHYPWLPVRSLLRERWDSVESLRGFDRPVALVVASDDSVIAPVFGHELFSALSQSGTQSTLFNVDGAGHNDWFGVVDEAWWSQVLAKSGLPD